MAYGVYKEYKVNLINFNKTEVSFEIESVLESGFKAESLAGFFLSKTTLFKQILRVAVDSTDRKFSLKFRVVDDKKTIYEFEALPERTTVKLNGHEITHKELTDLLPLHEKGSKKYRNLQELIGKYELFED